MAQTLSEPKTTPMQPQFPVYVISKGRAEFCLTAQFLREDGVKFALVCEPQEYDAYAAGFGPDREINQNITIKVLPFSNLGLGSIPARNWCWQDSIERGFTHHWILDDNIRQVLRRYQAQRLPCNAGPALRITEIFCDRYENIGLAGLNYSMFAPDNVRFEAYRLNCHLYSTLLIRNSLTDAAGNALRWRGRYNEDTDLCLQVLARGLCTVQMNAFLIQKIATMTMLGGNSDQLYQDDGRLLMAKTLERNWPGVVKTDRRWGRPQHVIKDAWKKFDTPLVRRSDIDWDNLPALDNFGLALTQVGDELRSQRLQALINEQRALNSRDAVTQRLAAVKLTPVPPELSGDEARIFWILVAGPLDSRGVWGKLKSMAADKTKALAQVTVTQKLRSLRERGYLKLVVKGLNQYRYALADAYTGQTTNQTTNQVTGERTENYDNSNGNANGNPSADSTADGSPDRGLEESTQR